MSLLDGLTYYWYPPIEWPDPWETLLWQLVVCDLPGTRREMAPIGLFRLELWGDRVVAIKETP